MNITQVTPSFYPDVGGVETVIREITNRLSNDKINHSIITCRRSKNVKQIEKINKFQIIYRFDKFAPNNAYHFSMKMIPFLRSYSNKNESIYHIHSYHALTSMNTRLFDSKPYIFSLYYHGGGHNTTANLFHIPYKLIAKNVIYNAEKIIAISQTEKYSIMRNFPKLEEENIALIPLGVDKSSIKELKREKSPVFTIVYVGRVEEYKGIQYMIKAIRKRRNQDIKLIIVGKGSYLPEIIQLIFRLGLQKSIKIDIASTGKEVYKYYSFADLIFSFSYKETYGITIAEALVANIPCLVPMSGALSEFIDNEICVGIKNLNDFEEVNEKIDRFLFGNSKTLIYQKKIYDWDDYYQSLKQIYLELNNQFF